MPLPLLEEELDHVYVELQRRREGDATGGWGFRRRLSHAEAQPSANGDDVSHRRVAIQHGYGFASPDVSQVFT